MSGRTKINKLFFPLSYLYGLGIGFRNKLFDWKILPVEEFNIPVISIGNLSVGGTGKTPHTEYLIRLLSPKYRVAVLSRGYKRKSSGFILADENADNCSIGDEPCQIHRKFPEILVAVDNNRRRGIRNLMTLPAGKKPEVILLDDAFQHRYVKPSLSILLSNFRKPFYNDCLLPAGRLREPAKNYRRADIIIFTKCPEESFFDAGFVMFVTTKLKNNLIYQTSFLYRSLLPVFPENNPIRKESIESLNKSSYSFLLIAGLADPTDMIRYLKEYTSDLHSMIYPDHHDFSRINILEIMEKFGAIQNKNKLIITSEKDAVRLINNPHIPEEIKGLIYSLPVEVAFRPGQEELFTQIIEDHVRNFKRNRIMAEAADTRRN